MKINLKKNGNVVINGNSTVNNKTNENTTTSQSTVKQNVKSNNANLSNLGITPNDFSGFTENKTNYSVSVLNSIKSVEVYAKAKDNKAKISGLGKVELKEGQNEVNVVVTAEDGTTKTYTIIITRLKEGEKVQSNNNSANIFLKNLKIEGLDLEPNFDSEKYVYSVNFEGEQNSLNIIAEASNVNNIVQIIGNENLIDGENIITIIVSDLKEENSSLYQIKVYKNLEEQQELQKQIKDSEFDFLIRTWIVKGLIIIIVVGIILLFILKRKVRKTKKISKQYIEDNDLPKSLRKEKIKEEKNNKSKKSKGKHSK